MAYALDLVNKVRGLRSDYNLSTKQKPQLYIACKDARRAGVLASLGLEIATLTYCSSTECLDPSAPVPESCGLKICDENTTVYLLLKGILDPELELSKLEKKVEDLAGRQEALSKKMSMASYAEKTPVKVQEADQASLEKLNGEQAAAEIAIAGFKAMLA
jgi:valyl-tRNA synthetase